MFITIDVLKNYFKIRYLTIIYLKLLKWSMIFGNIRDQPKETLFGGRLRFIMIPSINFHRYPEIKDIIDNIQGSRPLS